MSHHIATEWPRALVVIPHEFVSRPKIVLRSGHVDCPVRNCLRKHTESSRVFQLKRATTRFLYLRPLFRLYIKHPDGWEDIERGCTERTRWSGLRVRRAPDNPVPLHNLHQHSGLKLRSKPGTAFIGKPYNQAPYRPAKSQQQLTYPLRRQTWWLASQEPQRRTNNAQKCNDFR